RFVADQEAELDRADVTRFCQSVSDGKHAIRMTIVNQPAGDLDLSHLAIDLVVWFDQPLFNCCRVSHYLERRTWLVDILQRSVRDLSRERLCPPRRESFRCSIARRRLAQSHQYQQNQVRGPRVSRSGSSASALCASKFRRDSTDRACLRTEYPNDERSR